MVVDRKFVLFFMLVSLFFISFDSFASDFSFGASEPLGESLCRIVTLLTGKVGKAIATIALIFLAFGLFVGKVTWGLAVATGAAIATIFGSSQLIGIITGIDLVSC